MLDSVELSPEIKERMKKAFDTAVEVELHEYYASGVDTVLDVMEGLNMEGSLKLVEQKLIEKKILVSGDKENDNDEDGETNREKKRTIKESSEYVSLISRMIG